MFCNSFLLLFLSFLCYPWLCIPSTSYNGTYLFLDVISLLSLFPVLLFFTSLIPFTLSFLLHSAHTLLLSSILFIYELSQKTSWKLSHSSPKKTVSSLFSSFLLLFLITLAASLLCLLPFLLLSSSSSTY